MKSHKRTTTVASLAVAALIAGFVPAASISSTAAADPVPDVISPSSPYESISRYAVDLNVSPSNSGLTCGTEADHACAIQLSLTLAPEWTSYGAKMADQGISSLTVRIADCPTLQTPTTLLSAWALANVTLHCGAGETVSSLNAPLDLEWVYSNTNRSVPVGGVAPIPAPSYPFGYGGGSPLIETSRSVVPTAWPLSSGRNCGDAITPTACALRLNFDWAPGWTGDTWMSKMTAMGVQYGRLSIAASCPGNAPDAYTTDTILIPYAIQSFSPQISCGYTMGYSIPSPAVTWTFEWYSNTSGWIYGGSQKTAADQLSAIDPNLDLSQYSTALATITLSQVCDPLLFIPDGSPNTTSLPKKYQVCSALALSGDYSVTEVLAMLALRYGPTVLDILVGLNKATTAGPGRQVPETAPPRTQSSPAPLPPSGGTRISDIIQTADPTITPSDADKITELCRQLVADAAMDDIADASGVLRSPCEMLPIFVPGFDVLEATNHDLASIYSHPTTVLLHNATGVQTTARMSADGFSPVQTYTWRQLVPTTSPAYTSVGGTACITLPKLECDEYPFYSSKEGGPFGDPADPNTWSGFTITQISQPHNQAEGDAYLRFKSDDNCALRDPVTKIQTENLPFLVVPVPDLPLTTHICKGN